MKTCTKCKQEKPLDQFRNKKNRKGEKVKYSHCKECVLQWEREWYSNNKQRRQNKQRDNLLNKYNLTPETFEELFASQNYCCAICKRHLDYSARHLTPAIDHDHSKIKNVRGILCWNCNSGIGFFHENINDLLSAIEYLRKHNDLSD